MVKVDNDEASTAMNGIEASVKSRGNEKEVLLMPGRLLVSTSTTKETDLLMLTDMSVKKTNFTTTTTSKAARSGQDHVGMNFDLAGVLWESCSVDPVSMAQRSSPVPIRAWGRAVDGGLKVWSITKLSEQGQNYARQHESISSMARNSIRSSDESTFLWLPGHSSTPQFSRNPGLCSVYWKASTLGAKHTGTATTSSEIPGQIVMDLAQAVVVDKASLVRRALEQITISAV